MIIEGKTKSGFKFKIDERIAEDWRLMRYIVDSESADASVQLRGITNLVNFVLGADGSAKLEEHLAKKNDGFVPALLFSAEITEILQSIKELKN